MSIQQQTIDSTLAGIGSKATYTGAGFGFSGWWLSSEVGVFVGIIGVVGGLLVNMYYRRKDDRRRQAEHDLRMTLQADRRELMAQGVDE